MSSQIKIPSNVLNPEIYKKARKIADKTYSRAGAFKSMFIVRKYKELGGKYKGKKENRLERWRKERWVSVADYLEGKTVVCGDPKIGANLCRPTKRISKDTPITIQEVLKKHSKEDIKKIVNEKIKNLNKRVNWNNLTIN